MYCYQCLPQLKLYGCDHGARDLPSKAAYPRVGSNNIRHKVILPDASASVRVSFASDSGESRVAYISFSSYYNACVLDVNA